MKSTEKAEVVYLFPELEKASEALQGKAKARKDSVAKVVKNRDITYNWERMEWEGITVETVKFWEQCFPAVDVVAHLTQRMPAWLDAHQERKQGKRKWKEFIVNWLGNQQDRFERRG